MNATITTNTEHNGIEIKFAEKPARCTLDGLKNQGFRWHSKKCVWYAKNTPERMAAASAIVDAGEYALKILAEEKPATARKANNAPAVNKFGVRVGDIFSASWGWEQTNNDFFQVVALVGECSVRVREVCLDIVESSPVSGMSEDRVYKLTRDILPPASRSCFIEDQERGDIKRLKSYADDGKSNPLFKLSSFANAYLCIGDRIKVFESWYA